MRTRERVKIAAHDNDGLPNGDIANKSRLASASLNNPNAAPNVSPQGVAGPRLKRFGAIHYVERITSSRR